MQGVLQMGNGPECTVNVQVSTVSYNIYYVLLFHLSIFTELSCNKPKLPSGVTVHGRSYLYQDQLTYVCPNGKKQGLITCKADGYWSEPPICDNN